jgi:hypothetical protein
MQRDKNSNSKRPIYKWNAAFIEYKYQSVIASSPPSEVKNMAYGSHY